MSPTRAIVALWRGNDDPKGPAVMEVSATLLRRASSRLKDGYDRTTRSQRVLRRIRRLRDGALFDIRGALALVIAGAFLPPLLPIGLSLGLSADAATGFLQVLWQVEAATVALIITIVLFVFQIFSSRSESSVHDFAEETGFYPIFYIGLSAIEITGAVLLAAQRPAKGLASPVGPRRPGRRSVCFLAASRHRTPGTARRCQSA